MTCNSILEQIPRKAEERPAASATPGDGYVKLGHPLILRGAVSDWPSVRHAQHSDERICDYLLQFDTGAEAPVFVAGSQAKGRIFYDEDFTGLNAALKRATLSEVLNRLLAHRDDQRPPLTYIGGAPIAHTLPGFETENALDGCARPSTANIWIGGPTRISAHYDYSDNVACVVAGKRRFILFPPDQLENLYVGPLDFTPAGQPISLIDFDDPDHDRYPRFREALEHALIAELTPGDTLFIPSMWWHHVEALGVLNILVNHWFQSAPAYADPPTEALMHAVMTLRDLPSEERRIWRHMFEHYVFDPAEDDASHIPAHTRGILGPLDEAAARRMRAMLRARLNA